MYHMLPHTWGDGCAIMCERYKPNCGFAWKVANCCGRVMSGSFAVVLSFAVVVVVAAVACEEWIGQKEETTQENETKREKKKKRGKEQSGKALSDGTPPTEIDRKQLLRRRVNGMECVTAACFATTAAVCLGTASSMHVQYRKLKQ